MHQAIDAILCCSSFERAATLSTAASAMAKKIVPKLPLLFRTQHLQKCSDVRYCLPHAFDFKSLLFWWQILPVAILVLCYATLEIKQGQLKTWVQIPLTAYGGEKKQSTAGTPPHSMVQWCRKMQLRHEKNATVVQYLEWGFHMDTQLTIWIYKHLITCGFELQKFES